MVNGPRSAGWLNGPRSEGWLNGPRSKQALNDGSYPKCFLPIKKLFETNMSHNGSCHEKFLKNSNKYYKPRPEGRLNGPQLEGRLNGPQPEGR